jgi:uncharacterized protein (DUF1330 family)
MPAWVVAMMTVNDPETYKQYTNRTPATMRRFGGRFLHAAATTHMLLVQESDLPKD